MKNNTKDDSDMLPSYDVSKGIRGKYAKRFAHGTNAVAEKVSALMTESYLKERAARGSRKAFERIMARVPNVPPVAGDEI